MVSTRHRRNNFVVSVINEGCINKQNGDFPFCSDALPKAVLSDVCQLLGQPFLSVLVLWI